MKKLYSLLLAIIAFASFTAQSAGIYETYVILKVGSGGTDQYYDLQASTANPDFNGANLGSFATTSSLVVTGGQNKTYKCNGGDITGGAVHYKVYPVGATPGDYPTTTIAMSFISNDAGAGAGCQNQTWGGASGTTNIISGLSTGEYVLEVYTSATSNLTPGVINSDNAGSFYKANFTVGTLGVDDINGVSQQSKIAQGKLYTSRKGNLDIQVYDFSGKVVKTMKVNANGNPIDVNLAQKGLYLMKITDGVNSEVVKFSY